MIGPRSIIRAITSSTTPSKRLVYLKLMVFLAIIAAIGIAHLSGIDVLGHFEQQLSMPIR